MSHRPPPAAYAFGRDDVAARRLRMMHDLLAPASTSLLAEVACLGPFDVVLDLGCGPGWTSRLLDGVLRPGRLVGLDLSEPFLRLASAALPRGRFLRHDLLQLPWPGTPAGLAYARYVLTHLSDPEALVRQWMSQLRPGGLLVLEENEWIACRQPVFVQYLDTVGELLTGRGHDLNVGSRLAAIGPPPQRLSRVREVPAPTAHVAAMFRLNLSAWRGHPDLPRRVDVTWLDRELAELERSPEHGEITWGLRRLVFGRAEAHRQLRGSLRHRQAALRLQGFAPSDARARRLEAAAELRPPPVSRPSPRRGVVQQLHREAGSSGTACERTVQRPQDGVQLLRQRDVGGVVRTLSPQIECGLDDSREIVRQWVLCDRERLQQLPRRPHLLPGQ
jgi:SAM-dependent methyltransferase